MSLQDVHLVEELRKNKIEDNFRLLKVVIYITTFLFFLKIIFVKSLCKYNFQKGFHK